MGFEAPGGLRIPVLRSMRCGPQPAAIELAHLVAGATIGRLLAEQGANVIKVQPPIGDWVPPLWLDVNWTEKRIRARLC